MFWVQCVRFESRSSESCFHQCILLHSVFNDRPAGALKCHRGCNEGQSCPTSETPAEVVTALRLHLYTRQVHDVLFTWFVRRFKSSLQLAVSSKKKKENNLKTCLQTGDKVKVKNFLPSEQMTRSSATNRHAKQVFKSCDSCLQSPTLHTKCHTRSQL